MTFILFFIWSLQNVGGGDKEDDSTEEKEKEYNISKCFRRVESYADWMHLSREDLQELKASEMKKIHDVWNLKGR